MTKSLYNILREWISNEIIAEQNAENNTQYDKAVNKKEATLHIMAICYRNKLLTLTEINYIRKLVGICPMKEEKDDKNN